MEITRATNGRQTNSEENFNTKPKIATKHRMPTVKIEVETYSARGRNRSSMSPNLAQRDISMFLKLKSINTKSSVQCDSTVATTLGKL
jgi:hypothetical protein